MRACQTIRTSSGLLLKTSNSKFLWNAGSSHFTRSYHQNLRGSSYLKPKANHLYQNKRGFQHAENNATIYALSTAPGRAAIAIIRISGSACLTIYQALCPGTSLPKARYASVRTLYNPTDSSVNSSILDANAIILYLPSPNTVTGEDVLEFHVHGGTAVVKAVLTGISKAIPKGGSQIIRYAEPGEFTRRAFHNNRLDLLQIEALGDTLSADTEQQRRLAMRGSMSTQAHRYESWRQQLLFARGELEALIDFSEDQHFDTSPTQLCASVARQVQLLRSQLQINIENASRGELLRSGINVALIGAPNAGKSSLLNQIVGREAAIVSSEAGTTRDVVDVNIDIGGYFCRFGDLAGLRKESQPPGAPQVGEIEKEGMRRAKERALSADVIIAILPAVAVNGPLKQKVSIDIDPEVLEVLQKCVGQKIVFVLNKTDLFDDEAQLLSEVQNFQPQSMLKKRLDLLETSIYPVSCKKARNMTTNEPDPGGIQAFLDGLVELFESMTSAVMPQNEHVSDKTAAWAESLGATERQRTLLEQCLEHLESFLIQVQPANESNCNSEDENEDVDVVLAAESLRSAADCLARITGKGESGDVEEVLGVVFEKYDNAGLSFKAFG